MGFLRSTFCALGLTLSLAFSGSAFAQGMLTLPQQEQLIKISLLTFNDANITGNYTVFHAKLSRQLREQASPEKLKEAFKVFSEKELFIDNIVSLPAIPTVPAKIDDDGVMTLTGYFDTKPSPVKYRLRFVSANGPWKIIGINVDID